MFRTLLIANRGEIACRIIRTARRMGIATVAVHSDADAGALHVRLADRAVRIGPAPAAESYLSIEGMVAACKETGAEAVHPGYGFLSERAAFAEALEAEGIAWVGPNPRAIAAMGDKIESKRLAAGAGVSTVPGSDGAVESAAEAEAVADAIGYPVMVKASAGGGGKGMRVARSRAELAEGFARARSEARSSFGDDRVFVEKFVEDPRHVEVQVLGDRHGNVIHLGERECSVQRRNQKVLEEAPSPLLDAATRAVMGAQAVALARAVGYDSAGTVEFVTGQDRSFFFLEMNTRLQVEHPVTEMVTGLDLVERMIRVAAGEPLGIGQEDVRLDGWAVESRVYAEDPTRGFLPSTGRLTRYRPPPEGRDGEAVVRNDAGVAEGDAIPIHYDPMIAKLVTWAPTRAEAIEAQARALDRFAIDGIRHNLAFLAAIMGQDRWREGRLSTGYIAEEFPQAFVLRPPEGNRARVAAAAALWVDERLRRRRARLSGRMRDALEGGGERVVVHDGGRLPARVLDWEEGPETALRAEVGEGAPLRIVSSWVPGNPVWTGRLDGEEAAVQVRPGPGGALDLVHGGAGGRFRVLSPRVADLLALMPARAPHAPSKALLCPMPGLLRAVLAVEGQEVRAGEALAVVEAMKMENVLRADRDGTVKAVRAREGDTLAVDQVILEWA